MTQYTGFNAVATFGSDSFVCLSSVDVDMSADIYVAACAGQTWKSRVAGSSDATFTVNYMNDSAANDETDNMQPGVTGTFTMSTNTTTGPQYTAAVVVESHRSSVPVEGFVVGTIVFGVDASLTIA